METGQQPHIPAAWTQALTCAPVTLLLCEEQRTEDRMYFLRSTVRPQAPGVTSDLFLCCNASMSVSDEVVQSTNKKVKLAF